LPAVSTDVGDVANMVAEENRAFVVPPGDDDAFASALDRFASDAALRRAVGGANAAKALAEYDEAAMIAAYARLYGAAIGRADAFRPNLP